MRASRWVPLGLAVVGVLLGVGFLALVRLLSAGAQAAPGTAPVPAPDNWPNWHVPDQFIAKVYTEAYGRLPSQAEYTELVTRFQYASSCTTTVAAVVGEFYTGITFTALYSETTNGPDYPAMLLALFRGALNREIDASSYLTYSNRLAATWTWGDVVADVVQQDEFAQKSQVICALPEEAAHSPVITDAAYYWDGQFAPYAIDTACPNSGGCDAVFTGTTGAELAAALAAVAPSSTVCLPQQAVVWLSNTLTFPEYVTLTTCGFPTPTRYARMGRLVRAGTDLSPMVVLRDGDTLRGVWVDGQHAQLSSSGLTVPNAHNVEFYNSSSPPAPLPPWPWPQTTRIESCRLADPLGWTNVCGRENHWIGQPCLAGGLVTGNLVTDYASRHYPIPDDPYRQSRWVDGLGTECKRTVIEDNQIVDATDVGIVVFRSPVGTRVQSSTVRFNTVWNAGNSSYGDYGVEPYGYEYTQTQPISYSFAGATIVSNVLWTSLSAHVDIPLAVGTRALYGSIGNYALYPVVFGNTTADGSNPTQPAGLRCNIPILVSGARQVLLADNALDAWPVHTVVCPLFTQTLVLATVSTGTASFYTDTGHPVLPVYSDVPQGVIDCCWSQHLPSALVSLYLPIVFRNFTPGEGEFLSPPDSLVEYPPPEEPLPAPRRSRQAIRCRVECRPTVLSKTDFTDVYAPLTPPPPSATIYPSFPPILPGRPV